MNQSWTNKNIARSIMFGKCYLYVNTGNPGEFDKWHQFDFKSMSLSSEAITIPVIAGSGRTELTPFGSLTMADANAVWNFSQSKNGQCYSPFGTSSGFYSGPTGKFINGKYPAWEDFSVPKYKPGVASFIQGSFICTRSNAIEEVTVFGDNYLSRNLSIKTDVSLENPSTTNFSSPPNTTLRTRVIRDRFYLDTATNTFKDNLDASYSRSNGVGYGHPSSSVQIYTSSTFGQIDKTSKAIIIRTNYYHETDLSTASNRRLAIDVMSIPANSSLEVFPVASSIDLGLSDTLSSGRTEVVTVHIDNNFTRVRLAFPVKVTTTQWVYKVYDVNLVDSSYSTSTFIIGSQTTSGSSSNMLCSGIMWMDFDEITFGVLDGDGIRIVRNTTTVLSTGLPTGMSNTPADFSDLVSNWFLELPKDTEYGGHMELDAGKSRSIGYFLYCLVARKDNTFSWIDNGASAKMAAYRVLCGKFKPPL